MNTTLELYNSVVEEIDAVCTERIFNSRNERVLLYHDVGRIIKEKEDEGYGVTDLVTKLSADERLQGKEMGTRNLWFAVAFYKAYPDYNSLPDGKNLSVNKLKLLLAGPSEPKDLDFLLIARRIFDKYKSDAEKVYAALGELIATHEQEA